MAGGVERAALVCTTPGRNPGDHGMVEHEYGNYRYLAAFHQPGAWMVRQDELAEALAGHLQRSEPALASAT